MTVETITIGGKRYVVMPEEEYRRVFDEHGVPILSDEQMTEQDWGDVAEAKRREGEPARPYSELRKELGLG